MARVRLKMCGLVRPDDVAEAVRLGAEYLGFVFAEGGPRTVSPEHVEVLLQRVETRDALRVGVFRDQPTTWINAVARRCRLDLVQLHGNEPRDVPSGIRVPVLRVVRVAVGRPLRESEGEHAPRVEPLPPNVHAVLLDAADAAGRSGGLGLAPDLAALVAACHALPHDARIFVSGGLTPANVAERVRALRPWAVDVSSGVESAPGVKDPERMAAFVAALEQIA